MRLLRASDYPVNQWKNGGGETREIAVFPAGADMESFDWRISMATVARDGPFSVFDGIDRSLFILDGDGIELLFADGPVETLGPRGFLAFPADARVTSRLLGDQVVDLNIMSRRGRIQHSAFRIGVAGTVVVDCYWSTMAFFCLSGNMVATAADRPEKLGARDCLMIGGDQANDVRITGEGQIAVIGFSPVWGNRG
ncbi:HutD family protein [Leisingera sp. XS_AS12]|uniref:HutD/Ves family protein n=1 Tax=Leisingera sp. XS_AS12 TaxID=3241294 RepID=UPI003517F265